MSFGSSFIFLFIALFIIINRISCIQANKCKEELAIGKQVLRSMAVKLVNEERRRQFKVLSDLRKLKPSRFYRPRRFLAAEGSVCPEPNKTMTFSTSSPVMGIPNRGMNGAMLDSELDSNGEVNDSGVSRLRVPSMFYSHPDFDPYAMWMQKMYTHLEAEDELCTNAKFTALNTVTSNQFWGLLSVYLTNYATPLCPICNSVMSRIERTILRPNPVVHTEEERYMMKTILGHMPKAKSVCSSLLPTCHRDYQIKAFTLNGTTECLKCPLCTAGLKLLQHRFLLSAATVQDVLQWLQANVFHNICAELCIECLPEVAGQDGPCVFFPNGSDYNQCMNFTKDLYNFVIDAAKNILKPEYLCSVELEWCEINEIPNIMNCLREICQDGLPAHIADSVCKLIPSDPELAKKYLNTATSKKYTKSRTEL